MTERPQPYIGVSGVTNTRQQQELLDQFNKVGLDEHRLLALGVKATHKTQFLDQENKYGNDWYPIGEEAFTEALEPQSHSLHVAQAFLDPEYVSDSTYRNEFVERIRRRGAKWLDAIQFDMLPWHTDESLLPFVEKVKYETGLKILLQAHNESMQMLGPDKIVRRLGRYAHALDYVLFDASHGTGVRLETDCLRPFLEASYASDVLQTLGVSVAGGLNSTVVREDLVELVQDYPDLSWDAEGQLHPTCADGTRPLDIDMANEYIVASAEILRSV